MPSAAKVKYISFSTKRTFGVEVELERVLTQDQLQQVIVSVDKAHGVKCSGWDKTKNNTYWHVKTDSTCGPLGYKKDSGGWEIASYVAKGYDDLSNVGNVIKKIKEAGAKINNNCGFHVHAGTQGFSQTSHLNVLANWLRIENMFFQIVPEARRNNIYCLPLATKIKASGAIDIHKLHDKLYIATRNENDRRVALNLCNYVHGNMSTIELRLPEGTIDASIIKNWVRGEPAKLAKIENPEGYRNVLLYGKQLMMILQQQAMMAQMQQQTEADADGNGANPKKPKENQKAPITSEQDVKHV